MNAAKKLEKKNQPRTQALDPRSMRSRIKIEDQDPGYEIEEK
jgi:hypothetical protein